MAISLNIFLVIVTLLNICKSQSVSCDTYMDESSCISSTSACEWKANRNVCACSSLAKLDILLALDKSGSIGHAGWLVQKDFTRELVEQGISAISRIGFSLFSTTVNESRKLQYWDIDDLRGYVDGIWWSAGWTNTRALLDSALNQFSDTYQSDRHQILVIITDGNPCGDDPVGGCPHTVCEYKTQFKISGIKIAVVGVGDGLNTQYISCILDDPDVDFMPVHSFDRNDFNAIKDQLSEFLCPLADINTITTNTGGGRVILTALENPTGVDPEYWTDDYLYTDAMDDTLGTWINTAPGLTYSLGFTSTCNNNACADRDGQNQVWGFWDTTHGQEKAQMGHFFECDRNSIVDYSFTVYFCELSTSTTSTYFYVTRLSGDRASGIDNERFWMQPDGSFDDGSTVTPNTITGSGGVNQPGTTCTADLKTMEFSDSFETVGGVPFLINMAYQVKGASIVVAFNNFRIRCVFQATDDPTDSPTTEPTLSPTFEPSPSPTTAEPTADPTLEPTMDTLPPTLPTSSPTRSPLQAGETHPPTGDPTVSPTSDPTLEPTTGEPTTGEPTEEPTEVEIKTNDTNRKGLFWMLCGVVFAILCVVL